MSCMARATEHRARIRALLKEETGTGQDGGCYLVLSRFGY